MAVLYTNNAASVLASSLTASSSDTTLVVTTGDGDEFPIVASPDVAYATLEDSAGNIEIVQITARSSGSDSMTVVRAREGTTLQAWATGTLVEVRTTAAGLNSKANKVSGATYGNLAELDGNGDLIDSGVAESDKADKVSGATSGNLAELDASGNLVDSGVTESDKADKVSGATSGNLAELDGSGNLVDSGVATSSLGEFATGTYSVALGVSTADDSGNISHGLGTNDIDFGFKAVGSNNRSFSVVMVDPNNYKVIFLDQLLSTPTTVTPAPSANNVRLFIYNGSIGTNTITVHWWARKRS